MPRPRGSAPGGGPGPESGVVVPGPWEGAWSRRGWLVPRLVSQHALRQIPPPTPGDTATAADGTHPTGMHSCQANYFNKNYT